MCNLQIPWVFHGCHRIPWVFQVGRHSVFRLIQKLIYKMRQLVKNIIIILEITSFKNLIQKRSTQITVYNYEKYIVPESRSGNCDQSLQLNIVTDKNILTGKICLRAAVGQNRQESTKEAFNAYHYHWGYFPFPSL